MVGAANGVQLALDYRLSRRRKPAFSHSLETRAKAIDELCRKLRPTSCTSGSASLWRVLASRSLPGHGHS